MGKPSRNQPTLASLGLHPPTLICPHQLTYIDDHCPICDPPPPPAPFRSLIVFTRPPRLSGRPR